MSPERLSYYQTLLKNYQQNVLTGGDQKAEPIHQDAERPDEDGQPLTEMSQVISSTRNQSRAVILSQIQSALVTLRHCPEDFGVCEECDEDIPEKRLELMPWVPYCVRCQGKQEITGRGATRRNLTDYVT